MNLRTYLILLVSFLVLGNSSFKPEKRIALIIGMSNYKEVDRLPLCKNDADSISAVLQKLDFEVYKFHDLSKENMDSELSKWSKLLKNCDVALFYFSGHGAEVQGENYLFPVDARLTTPAQTKYSTVPLGEILDILQQAKEEPDSKLKTNLIILDACRDNPYTKSWSKSLTQKGLANISLIPNGTFIGYATSPGKTASALGKNNSPYTLAILKNISKPNESINDVFTDVNATTRYLTGGEQTPFISSSFDTKFYFKTEDVKAKSVKENNLEFNFKNKVSNKIKDFVEVVPLGSSLNDVLVSEFGPNVAKLNYSELTVAPECKDKLIKYYWRKLSQSSHLRPIVNYTAAYGLTSEINDNSYIVYMFYNDKLVLISIRLFYNQIEVHKKMAESFNIDVNKYPSKFDFNNGDFYSFFALEKNMNVSTISIGEKDSDKYCSYYWYGEPNAD